MQAYICKGDALMAMEQFEAAGDSYSMALELDPSIRRSKSFKVITFFCWFLVEVANWVGRQVDNWLIVQIRLFFVRVKMGLWASSGLSLALFMVFDTLN